MAEPIQVGDSGGDRNRRVVLLAAAAAVILLAVVVLPGLLFGGDDAPNDDELFGTPSAGVTTTTVQPSEPAPETFEVFTSKNPFRPLVAAAPVADSTTEVVPDETLVPEEDFAPLFPDGGDFVFPDDGGFIHPDDDGAPPPDGSGGQEPTTSTTAGPPPRQPDRVGLLEVFTDPGGQVVASVRVNDLTHQVAEGDVFSTSYRVVDLDISTRCGQFLFGDDRFSLCEGDEVLE